VGKNQADIVKFLNDKGISIEESSNAKVDDTMAILVIEKFAPEIMVNNQMVLQEEEISSLQNESLTAEETKAIFEEPKVENELPVTSVVQDLVQNEYVEEKSEVIKAPKIELQGLKVLGKIDLPPTKVKSTEKEPPSKIQSKGLQNEVRRNQRSEERKNPIAFEREREEKEKERKKLEKAAYLKELKTQRYLNKVRKPIDIYKEPKLAQKPEQKLKPIAPKKQTESVFSRFLKWLTLSK
jgi:hypothetical protein